MKTEKYNCDVCKIEISSGMEERLQVIFETEQNEGRSTKPYLCDEKLELCDKCMKKVLEGNYIFASGAMGHNIYYFKNKKKI